MSAGTRSTVSYALSWACVLLMLAGAILVWRAVYLMALPSEGYAPVPAPTVQQAALVERAPARA